VGAAAGGAAAEQRRVYTDMQKERWDARRKDKDEDAKGSTVGGWRQE
jgi:hypothetical protein